MVQMLGWLSAEAARASRWKRSSVFGDAVIPSGRTLIATTRSRRVSLARYTSPIPPTPSGLTISWGARRALEARAKGGPDVLLAPIVVASGRRRTPRLLASRSGSRRSAEPRAHATFVADQVTLAPALGSIRGIRAGLLTGHNRSRYRAVTLDCLLATSQGRFCYAL